jgi:hypothetical protein
MFMISSSRPLDRRIAWPKVLLLHQLLAIAKGGVLEGNPGHATIFRIALDEATSLNGMVVTSAPTLGIPHLDP